MNRGTPERRIVLTGFMCAGKTTVAHALAARLRSTMLDTDALIVERTGRTVEAIIREDGEPRFRQLEQAALRDALENRDGARVIALGGGAWAIAENRAFVNAHYCLTVWLDATFELCWQRIAADSHDARPLARNRDAARQLYEARRAHYAEADLRVRVGADEGADSIALRIISALTEWPPSSKD